MERSQGKVFNGKGKTEKLWKGEELLEREVNSDGRVRMGTDGTEWEERRENWKVVWKGDEGKR